MDIQQTDLASRKIGDVAVFTPIRGGIKEALGLSKKLNGLSVYVAANPGCKIILDLVNVDYLSSHTVGALVGLMKQIEEVNGSLRLCSLQKPIRDLFEVLLMARLFKIHDNIPKALASLELGRDQVVTA